MQSYALIFYIIYFDEMWSEMVQYKQSSFFGSIGSIIYLEKNISS